MRSDLPTGTVTFLFTDVEGSTSLLRKLGAEAYADALAEHRRVVREACAARGGVEVDAQGDAFFVAFPSAPGAASAALAITQALASGPISLRIGLHTGTPLVTDEGYVGEDVHFAARVAASGPGGQVLLSKSAHELVEGLSVTDLGEHRLKDIEGAVAIHQLGEKTFPPLKTISNTNLPRPASSFIGRKGERTATTTTGMTTAFSTTSAPVRSGRWSLSEATSRSATTRRTARTFTYLSRCRAVCGTSGRWSCAGYYERDDVPDRNGDLRRAIVFELVALDDERPAAGRRGRRRAGARFALDDAARRAPRPCVANRREAAERERGKATYV